MSVSAVVGIVFVAAAITAIEGARYYLDHSKHAREDNLSPQPPAYTVCTLPTSGSLTAIMGSLFEGYDFADVRVASLIVPASEWPRIKREFNASISHESPDAVGTMWGAEVFLHRSDSLVVVALPNENDLDCYNQLRRQP